MPLDEIGIPIVATVSIDDKSVSDTESQIEQLSKNLQLAINDIELNKFSDVAKEGFGFENSSIEEMKSQLNDIIQIKSLLEERKEIDPNQMPMFNIGGQKRDIEQIANIIAGYKDEISASDVLPEVFEESATKAEEMKSSMSQINLSDISEKVGSIGKDIKSASKQAMRFTLSLIGIRSAYGTISKAVNSYLGKNELLQQKISAAWYALGSLLSPAVEYLITLLGKAVQFVNLIVQGMGFAGINMKNFVNGAKEANKQLMGFDEINNMSKTNNFAEQAKQWLENITLSDKLANLATSIGLTIKDVFIDWDNLTLEQILEKLNVGLLALAGLCIGGIPGMFIGAGLGIMLDALVFDHDGVLDEGELKASLAASTLAGALIGFKLGGPLAALGGAAVAASLMLIVTGLKASKGGMLTEEAKSTASAIMGFLAAMFVGVGAIATFIPGAQGYGVLAITVGVVLGISTIKLGEASTAAEDVKAATDEAVNNPMNESLEAGQEQAELTTAQTIAYITNGITSNQEQIIKAWETIKVKILDVWSKMEIGVKTSCNNILGSIEGMINNIVSAFNDLADELQSINSQQKEMMGLSFSIDYMSHIKIPRLATGTNYVPEDQLAYIHKGEAVVPKEFNPNAFYGQTSAEELNLLVAINEQLIELNRKDTTIELDGENVAKTINNKIQMLDNRNGTRVFNLAR